MFKTILTSLIALCALPLSEVSAQDSIPAKGLVRTDSHGSFQKFEWNRRPVGDDDVLIEILYAGICHSDIHYVNGDWRQPLYPVVPGHEIAGVVTQVGKNVTKFKVGDYAGVGCMVGSCGTCPECTDNMEQYCKDVILTYGSIDKFHNNEKTQGGYSNNLVVPARFAISIPQDADLQRVAPLLCAGVTTYSPIHRAAVKKGDKVAIAGFGGLGHMAVQYAVALGAEVSVFDPSEDKRADASRLGAKHFYNVTNPDELKGLENSFDFVLSTIPANYDPAMYLRMLKRNGQMAIVGLPAQSETPSLSISSLVYMGNRNVFGSMIGGIKETQEMLDYSVKNHIYPDVEIISASPEAVNDAYNKVRDGKVKFRYVIDMKTIN